MAPYTSTCVPAAGYDEARCPDATGDFAQGYGGSSAYIYFYGDDGSVAIYRWSGPVGAPESMASGGLTGTIIDRGAEFQCSQFFENTYKLVETPLVYTDASGSNVFASGSDDPLGPRSADNWVTLSETALNYFEKGYCNDEGDSEPTPTPTPEPTPGSTSTLHIGDLDGASQQFNRWKWWATVSITVLDANLSPVPDATVSGAWSTDDSAVCTTDGAGICSVRTRNGRGIDEVTFTVTDVSHNSLTYDALSNRDGDGDSTGTVITVKR